MISTEDRQRSVPPGERFGRKVIKGDPISAHRTFASGIGLRQGNLKPWTQERVTSAFGVRLTDILPRKALQPRPEQRSRSLDRRPTLDRRPDLDRVVDALLRGHDSLCGCRQIHPLVGSLLPT